MQKPTETIENPVVRIINGREWVVTLDKEKVIDVSVRLTKGEYEEAQRKLADPNSTFQNTSSLGLLKNGFAKARSEALLLVYEHIQATTPKIGETQDTKRQAVTQQRQALVLSDFLNVFENQTTQHLELLNHSINRVFSSPETQIKELIDQINAYAKEIVILKKDTDEWLKNSGLTEAQQVFVREDLNQMYDELLNNAKPFYTQLMSLKAKGATVDEVELLLSAQNRGDIHSLGSFLGAQTQAIADAAIKITTTLNGRYLLDLYGKNEITAAFIETKAKLRLKNTALIGAEFGDTYSATKTNELPEAGLFSVMPYLEGDSAADLDKIICLISEKSLSHRSMSTAPKTALGSISYASARTFKFLSLYLAPLTELILTPLHFVAVLALIPYRLVNNERADRWSANLLKLHSDYSLVKKSKRDWNTQYKRLDDDGNLVKNTDPHQEILELYKNDDSLAIRFFELVSPRTLSEGASYVANRAYEFVSQTIKGLNPRDIFKPAKTNQDTFEEYVQNYHYMKPIMQYLRTQADQNTQNSSQLKHVDKFPGIIHQRANKINSPARVICDVMYIFDEHIINHLAETRPGPATLFFLISAGTFGANLAPTGALAWMHGAPSYLQLIPTQLSKYFTGYTGTMAGPNGALAATLQFKLSTMTTLLIGQAFDKNNTILERMASNPEEVMAAFVAFVGIGYAVGFIPKIPLIPSNFPGLSLLNGYGEAINAVVHEAAVARNGLMPLTSLEYGFLGFKALLVFDSMTSNGQSKIPATELQLIMQEFKNKNSLDPNKSASVREEEIRGILKTCKSSLLKSEKNIQAIIDVVNQTMNELPNIHQKMDQITQHITEERDAFASLIGHAQDHKASGKHTSFDTLQQALEIFSDPNTPITFPANHRREAIQCYNHLSQLFDTYNNDVKKGLYPEHNPIPKADYLQAFRNQHCSTGSNNFARLISFYPGYPVRFLWRATQLAFNPTPFVKDKIQASKEKDVVLRHQWTAIIKNAGYALINLVNKSIKAFVGFLPALVIIGQETGINIGRVLGGKVAVDFNRMSLRLQTLGRWLDKNISIQNELPTTALRSRVAAAAHAASDYNDLQEAGVKVNHRIQENIKAHTSHDTYLTMTRLQEHNDDMHEWEEDSFLEAPQAVHSQHTTQQETLCICGTVTTEIESIMSHEEQPISRRLKVCQEVIQQAEEKVNALPLSSRLIEFTNVFFQTVKDKLTACKEHVHQYCAPPMPLTSHEVRMPSLGVFPESSEEIWEDISLEDPIATPLPVKNTLQEFTSSVRALFSDFQAKISSITTTKYKTELKNMNGYTPLPINEPLKAKHDGLTQCMRR